MSTGYQQHHTSSHKASKSESHELSEIHDNPVSAGYGTNDQYNQTSLPGTQHAALPGVHGAQQSALPAPHQSAAQTSHSTGPTATSSPLPGTAYTTGAGTANPVTSSTPTQTTGLGSHSTTGASAIPKTGTAYNAGATPGTGAQSTVPTHTHTGGYNTSVPGSHTGVHSRNNTGIGGSSTAPVKEISQLGISSAPGTGVHNSTAPGHTGNTGVHHSTVPGHTGHTGSAGVHNSGILGHTGSAGAHNTTIPGNTGGHVSSSVPGTHSTGLGSSHSNAGFVPGTGSVHSSTVPGHHTTHHQHAPSATTHHVPTTTVGAGATSSPAAYNAGAVPTSATTSHAPTSGVSPAAYNTGAVPAATTTTHAPINGATGVAAQNADAALNRALNASSASPGAGRVGGSSTTVHGAPGNVPASGVNPVPVDRSAVAAADSAAQALGHVLGGTPSAAVGQPRAVQSTTTTPAGVHSALHTAVPHTVTHTNTATGAPATVQTASSGLATHSHTSVPATTHSAVPSGTVHNTSGVPAGGVGAPGVYTATTSPAAAVAGTHPNPTHVSNQYRPGSTYNTAPTGAAVPGAVPPAYKEGKHTSANLPVTTL